MTLISGNTDPPSAVAAGLCMLTRDHQIKKHVGSHRTAGIRHVEIFGPLLHCGSADAILSNGEVCPLGVSNLYAHLV